MLSSLKPLLEPSLGKSHKISLPCGPKPQEDDKISELMRDRA